MVDKILSRREFLRLMGAGLLASVGGFFVSSELSKLINQPSGQLPNSNGKSVSQKANLIGSAYAQTAGSWSIGPSTTGLPIHATVLRTGEIFYLAGSGYNLNTEFGPYIARVYNPSNGNETSVSLNEDLFCAGNVQLADGNVLLAGGTQLYDIDPSNCNGYWHGAKFAYEYDIQTSSLVKVASMQQGRWYPTCVLLADGRVFVTGGMDDYGTENRLVELYNPASKSWNIVYDSTRTYTYCVGSEFVNTCPGAGSPCYGGTNNAPSPWLSLYPRMHLLPSGLLVTAGPVPEIRTWNPSNGQWRDVGTISNYRSYGTSILLPLQNSTSERGKVLIVGGSTTDTANATTSVQMLDFNQGTSTTPVIRSVQSIRNGRKFLLPMILPNGRVLVLGGSSQSNENPVYVPEMFNPVNEAWTNLPAATVPRVYHGVALLLPDGSVWTASSSISRTVSEFRTEIYRPDYFFSGPRPTISGAPTVGNYGNSITIPTPDATNISTVSLVKLPCTTHHYDTDARLLWLQVTSRTSNTVRVSAPINANLAPPGYYMIHVLNGSSIPSTARIIKIPGVGTGIPQDSIPPSQVTGLTVTVVSSNQLNLNWTANTETDLDRYNVYRGTTAGFSVTPGTTTPVSQPTANSFSDTTLASSTTYYYKVAAVDTSGNIGPLSLEQSGTTSPPPPDTTPPAQVTGLSVTPVSSTQLNLAWTQNIEQDLHHYNVYQGTSPGFTVSPGTTPPIGTPASNTFSNTGLSPTTTYYYKVAAVDNAGNIGLLSVERSGTTNAPPDTTPPSQVTGLTVTVVSSNQLNLNWTANTETDLDRYNVYRGTTAGFSVTPGTTTPVSQPTANSFSDTTLASSTTYYYKVAAVDTSGNIGPLSLEQSGTTPFNPVFYNVASPGNSIQNLKSGSVTRYGEEPSGPTSLLVGKPIRSLKVRLRKKGNPSGSVVARIRRKSDDAIVLSFTQTIQASSLGNFFGEYTFTLPSPYSITSNDRILIEYSGQNGVDVETWNTDRFDGTNTRTVSFSGGYTSQSSSDLVGSMSE
jgi:fibronectin type 3 domain-containing protein